MTDAEWGKWFEKHGPAVGEPMLDATLMRLDGTKASLAELWKDRPAIITTASLTCPIARDRVPMIDRLLETSVESQSGRVVVPSRVVIYCREAHPVGSPAPHGSGREWVTPANRQAGILYRQPETIEQRLALARLLQENWLPEWTFLVDDMNDTIYHALGTASCMGLAVDRKGVVRAKQGWLDPSEVVRIAFQEQTR